MDKKAKVSRDVLKIVEIILLLIVILLVIILIGLEIMHNEYATYDRIYNYRGRVFGRPKKINHKKP